MERGSRFHPSPTERAAEWRTAKGTEAMDKIGIKLANSEFYPILDHGMPARKRLVVTTVNDRQKSAQIDLYRGQGPMVTDAVYVGSLVVEDIPEGKAGEPDVRLDLELDDAGMLKCTAVEAETGTTQSLRVSLESLGEENSYEIPDFDLEGEQAEPFDEEVTDSLPDEATGPEEGASLLSTSEEILKARSRRPILPWILLGLLILVVAAVLGWIFLFQSMAGPTAVTEPAPAAAASPAPTTASPDAAAPAAAPPAASATAATSAAPAEAPSAASATAASVADAAPATSEAASPAPAAPPKALAPSAATTSKAIAARGKATPAPRRAERRYRIKWGDTLWDLAWVYYRDPWLYPRIAKANRIRNPDRILSGTWIVIPGL